MPHRHLARPTPPALLLEPGRPWPLGAHWDGNGVNFAVFSAHADSIELCIFDSSGQEELSRTPLPSCTQDVFHGRLAGAGPGLVYGLRAHGRWRPERGLRFNPNKLLLDPYAREIVGTFAWRDEHYGADLTYPQHRDMSDNAVHALKARVVCKANFDWGDDARLHRPVAETVIYEVHVKGFTKQHPDVPEELRGTYAGLASDAAIAHLQNLGVTAVCLLPVHQHVDEHHLAERGLCNYWGYNTVGFFCPEPTLASGRPGVSVRDEFRSMVKRLHAAGIEVLLDVVFNHTAEGDERGPTISFRGLDNSSYYRLQPQAQAHYVNDTGCGNTVNVQHPRVAQLVLDSLRFWVGEMHVDGFRFDLAPVLGRTGHGFDRQSPLFTALAQDPLLAGVKMIAEPWDIGPGGYQLGHFPSGWLEWNDQFRDTLRRFWVTGSATRGELALRLCGSADVFQASGRRPAESINYVTSHDGFCLRDVVSFERKHNHANGENNRDGHEPNHSRNFGFEGASRDPAILERRGRVQRALLACTILAQGTPMLCAGDEIGRSQGGNNNAYCQDNAINWIDWSTSDAKLLAFTRRVLALRASYRPLDNQRWYDGVADSKGIPDLTWYDEHGEPMGAAAWQEAGQRTLICLIGRAGLATSPLLLLINGDEANCRFRLPRGPWRPELDSSSSESMPVGSAIETAHFDLAGHSLAVFTAAQPA